MILALLLTLVSFASSQSPDILFGRCAPDSCNNGGDCHQIEKLRYICQCDDDHYGFQCEHKRTEECLRDQNCPSSNDICGKDRPCAHGFCKNIDTGFSCWCPVGYSGKRCEVEDPHQVCRPDLCAHGHCIIEHLEPKCVCDDEWTGEKCDEEEESTTECYASPCAHTSLCLNTSGTIECVCAVGRTGPRCEFELNLCTGDLDCQNGGYCLNNKCICKEGFEGSSCELEQRDPCLNADNSRRCMTYQDCVANRTNIFGYSCVCPPGFEGHFCDVMIDTQKIQKDTIDYFKCYLRACSKLAGNGICDQECNHFSCGYDGGDCSSTSGRNCILDDFEGSGSSQEERTICTMTEVRLTVMVKPATFVRKIDDFLSSIAQRLRTWVRIKKTEGEMDVFELDSKNRQGARVRFGSRTDARAEYSTRVRRDVSVEKRNGLLVFIQVGLAECSSKCHRLLNFVAHSLSDTEWREERWEETRYQSATPTPKKKDDSTNFFS